MRETSHDKPFGPRRKPPRQDFIEDEAANLSDEANVNVVITESVGDGALGKVVVLVD